MKILMMVLLILLVLLSIASGVAKLMLVPEEAAFFARYGFSNMMLMTFGAVQVLAGTMMIFKKFRAIGAYIVLATFGLSLILLLMDGSYGMSAITIVVSVMLMVVVHDKRLK